MGDLAKIRDRRLRKFGGATAGGILVDHPPRWRGAAPRGPPPWRTIARALHEPWAPPASRYAIRDPWDLARRDTARFLRGRVGSGALRWRTVQRPIRIQQYTTFALGHLHSTQHSYVGGVTCEVGVKKFVKGHQSERRRGAAAGAEPHLSALLFFSPHAQQHVRGRGQLLLALPS